MKLLLTVVALAAFARASPITTMTMEIGADGVQSGSVHNIPLVEIIIKVEVVVPETANEPVLEAEPVIVVDEAQNLPDPIDVISILPQPEVVPAPALPEPGNPINVISVNPVVPQPEVVPAPIGLPEPTPAEVVPAPIVLPEPTPAEVVPAPIVVPEPTPAEVIEVEPVQVVEEAPETLTVAGTASSSPMINVMMNFVFGNSNTMSST